MAWKIGEYNYEGLIGITYWNYVSLDMYRWVEVYSEGVCSLLTPNNHLHTTSIWMRKLRL